MATTWDTGRDPRGAGGVAELPSRHAPLASRGMAQQHALCVLGWGVKVHVDCGLEPGSARLPRGSCQGSIWQLSSEANGRELVASCAAFHAGSREVRPDQYGKRYLAVPWLAVL